MNKRIICLLAMAAVLFSGCQLAIAEKSPSVAPAAEMEDRIVGMLITLDSSKPDEEVDDELLHLIPNRGKRIYASLREESYEAYDGAMRTTHRMVFPEDLGLVFMGYEVSKKLLQSMSEEETYWTNTVDEGIRMEKNHFKTLNDESFVQLEACIYVSDEATDLILYMNPVYQNSRGEIYALGTAPMGYHGTSMDASSVSYGSTLTKSQDGEIMDEDGSYVKLTMRVVTVPDYYRIVQMDADNAVLTIENILPKELPEEYVPQENCAYMILEEYASGQVISRSVKSPDDSDSALDVLYPMDNGICHYGYTQVRWEE